MKSENPMGKLKSLISARTLIARSALLCEMENVSLTSAGELTAIQLKHASHIFTISFTDDFSGKN